MPAVFQDLFAATGDPLERTLALRRVDPHCHYRFDDGSELDSAGARDALDDALRSGLGEEAATEWDRLLDRAQRIWNVSREAFLESAGPPRLLDLARRQPAQLPVIAPGRTLRWLARTTLTDPRLRTVLERYATYAGSDPRFAPAALAATAFIEQEYGCWYVEGGLHQIATALAARIPEVCTGVAVTGIATAGGRVSGVHLEGGELLAADAVVSDVDATHLYGELLARPRLLPRVEPSLAGFVMLLGLRDPAPDLGHHTVLFPSLSGFGYAAEFDWVFGGRLSPVPTVYVSAPVDPAVAPGDGRAVFVLVNAPRHGPFDWDQPKVGELYARHLLEVMAARGLDLRDRILFCETRTPADLQRETGAPGGAIYGASSHGTLAAFRRAANRSPVPACSSPARVPIPAAACPWSPCQQPRWLASSAPLEL